MPASLVRLPFLFRGLLASAVLLALHGLFIAATVATWNGRRLFTLFDDAMISMRYARNLAQGNGLVWNVGERVEGFSNPLWTLWMAVVHALGVTSGLAPLVVALSSSLLLLATAWVTWAIARRLALAPHITAAVVVATGLAYAPMFWALRGMEVGALTLGTQVCILAAVTSRDGRASARWILGVTVLAMSLTRMDSALVPLVVAGCYAVTRARDARRVVAIVVVAVGAGLLLQTAARLAYYGEWLPNTYYLKLTGVTLAARLARGLPYGLLTVFGAFAPAVIGGLWVVRGARDSRSPDVAWAAGLLATLLAVLVAYSMYVGGDAWEWMLFPNRYLAPAVPAAVLLAGIGVQAFEQRGGPDAHPLRALPAVFAWTLPVPVALYGALAVDVSNATTPIVDARVWTGVVVAGCVCAALIGVVFAVTRRTPHPPTRQGRPVNATSGVASAVACLGLVLAFSAGSTSWGWWGTVARGVNALEWDTYMARFGLWLNEHTAPGLSVMNGMAGNLPYFADRPAVDFLGKTDLYIARVAPRERFFPGHDKYDMAHSLGALRPDIVILAEYHEVPPEVRDLYVCRQLEWPDRYQLMKVKRSSLAQVQLDTPCPAWAGTWGADVIWK